MSRAGGRGRRAVREFRNTAAMTTLTASKTNQSGARRAACQRATRPALTALGFARKISPSRGRDLEPENPPAARSGRHNQEDIKL